MKRRQQGKRDRPEKVVAPDERVGLEEAKRASVGQLLFKCARQIDELAIARLRETPGLEGLRRVHTNLFPHIDLEGTRLTQLAARVGISKQAVGQLVDELVELGGLERVADPHDGRAKLIRFRRRGGRFVLMQGLDTLREIEGELEAELGAAQMRSLHAALLRLAGILEVREPAPR